MTGFSDWERVFDEHAAWWRNARARPLVLACAPREDTPPPAEAAAWSFPAHAPDINYPLRLWEAALEATSYHGAAFPMLWPNFGPGVLAAYFTDYFEYRPESETVWFERPMEWPEIDALDFSQDNRWWRLTLEATRAAAARAKGRYIVGHTDIGGPLDVLASFRGAQQLCLDLLLEDPARIREACRRVETAWERVYDRLHEIVAPVQRGSSAWMGLWAPGRWYPHQCDFSAMISPADFERFVVPSIERHCAHLDHNLYHLDGPGQIPHLDLLLDIPALQGIQWVPGSGNPQCESERWLPLYRRILERDKLLVLQTFDDPFAVFPLLERLPRGRVALIAGLANTRDAEAFAAAALE